MTASDRLDRLHGPACRAFPMNALMSPAALAASAALGGLAWSSAGHPAIALLVAVPWGCATTRWRAWLLAFAYYAAALHDVPALPARYFPQPALWAAASGLAAWLGWAALLAAAQAAAWLRCGSWRWLGVVLGMILTAAPPLGWLAAASPLNAIGYWFPATAWTGLALGLASIAWLAGLAARPRGRARVISALAGAALALASSSAWWLYRPALPPPGWMPQDTRLGPAKQDGGSSW